MKETNIVICGVGGQGTVLAAQLLGSAAVAENLSVRVGETHGMAQRGGSVVSHVRIGDVYGPITPEGKGHVLVGFEPMEAVRSLPFLARGGTVLVNTRPVVPLSVILGMGEELPVDTAIAILGAHAGRVIAFDASACAAEAGSPRAVNTVLLGALGALDVLPFSGAALEEAMRRQLSPKILEANLEAFRRGAQHAANIVAAQ